MNEIETVLRAADRLLTEQGWCQDHAIDPVTHAVCLGQAINHAADLECGSVAVGNAAERVLLHIVNARVRPGYYNQIFIWNDESTTTVEDVHLLIKEGIEAVAT